MKITSVNNAQQVNNVKKAQNAYAAADQPNASRLDEVQLSETAKTFSNAVKGVKDQIMDPVSRQQKIDRIKEQLEAGTYQVDSRDVAAKMLGMGALGDGE